MNVIRGCCYTNLDEYKSEVWPSQFVSVPLVGARIESRSGKKLTVSSITHTLGVAGAIPLIKVELTKRCSSF